MPPRHGKFGATLWRRKWLKNIGFELGFGVVWSSRRLFIGGKFIGGSTPIPRK
jgi:hypothetical protein